MKRFEQWFFAEASGFEWAVTLTLAAVFAVTIATCLMVGP